MHCCMSAAGDRSAAVLDGGRVPGASVTSPGRAAVLSCRVATLSGPGAGLSDRLTPGRHRSEGRGCSLPSQTGRRADGSECVNHLVSNV